MQVSTLVIAVKPQGSGVVLVLFFTKTSRLTKKWSAFIGTGAACNEAPAEKRPVRLLGLTAAAQSNELAPRSGGGEGGRWANPERQKRTENVASRLT